MMNPIWNVIIGLAASAAGAIIAWLLQKYSGVWQQRALNFVNDVVVDTVLKVNQLYVDKRKEAEASGDGVFDDTERAIAKKMCMDLIWATIPQKILKHFYAWFGGDQAKAETYVDTLVESTVRTAKVEGL